MKRSVPSAPGNGSEPMAAPTGVGWSRRSVWRFLSVFGALLSAYYAVVLIPVVDGWFYEYLRANAWLANGILRCLGQGTHVEQTTIRGVDFAVSVRRGCDALEPAWYLAAAVLAYPIRWRRKPWAILNGVAIILALNLVRIVSLFLIGRRAPALFASAHLEWWPVMFILTVLVLWIAWIRREVVPAQDHHVAV